MDVVICGRLLGTAAGWDGVDSFAVQFYDFYPIGEARGRLPECAVLTVDYEGGNIEAYQEGAVSPFRTLDLVSTIYWVPRGA